MLLTRRAPTVSMVDTRSAPKTTSSSSSSSTSRSATSTSSSSSKTTSQQSQTNTSKSSASASTASPSKSSTVSKTVASVAQTVIKDVVSISQAARQLAATSSVSNGAVGTLNKNQFLQADKGIGSGQHFEKMVDNGGGVKETYPLKNPPHNTPKISTNPGHSPIYVNQNSHTEASSNPTKGTITYTNGSYHEVIAERDPLLQAMNDVYDQYKRSNAAVAKAFQSGDKQALDEAVVAMKKTYLDAEVSGNEAAKKAASKMATELRGMGATIGNDVTLEQAKTKVIESRYNSMATSNSLISNGLANGTRLSLDEAVTETKRLFAEAERSNDEVSKTAAHMLANHLRTMGATMPADVTYEQAAANVTLQKLYNQSKNTNLLNWDVVKTGISLGMDLIPVVGDVKAGYETFSGKDMITGETVSPEERLFNTMFFFVPGKGWVKAGAKIGDEVIDAAKLRRTENMDTIEVVLSKGKLSVEEMKQIGNPGSPGIRVIKGDADDAYSFFLNQADDPDTIKEIPGGVIGRDKNGLTFTYRQESLTGPPTVDVNPVKGLRKIKFTSDGQD